VSDPHLTRLSWNLATRNHNAHKGDQAAFLRGGGETLFPEELALLGPLEAKTLVHLQCNSGQDSLCLARRGARVTGVDFSDEAISFARRLGVESGIEATFLEAELLEWMAHTSARFDLAFSSYGAVEWLPDLRAWAEGIHRILVPGGRFVYVEFHPLVWSVGKDGHLSGDDYFAEQPFVAPVSDYVAASAGSLLAVTHGATVPNEVPATSHQYTLGQIVSALVSAGLRLERLEEYPFANGCRVNDTLVPSEGRRWVWPEGVARVPLMFGLSVRKAG
jgi:SAM-dependent methyltransferase